MSRRSTPDLDTYEDPTIVSTDSRVDHALKLILNRYEGIDEPNKIDIKLYMLAVIGAEIGQTAVVGAEIGQTVSLVITSRYIYVIEQDYGNVPSPSFVVSPPLKPVFEVCNVHGLFVNIYDYL